MKAAKIIKLKYPPNNVKEHAEMKGENFIVTTAT